MSFKKFSTIALSIIFFIFIFNAVVWHLYTKQWFAASEYYIGDLSRMGYLPDSAHPRKTFVDLPKLHKSMQDIKKGSIDMLVLGDSFTYGNSQGKNPSFTDYIASKYGMNIFITDTYPSLNTSIETIILLANSGFFDIYKPKIVLIELTERKLAYGLAGNLNFDLTDSVENIKKTYGIKERQEPPKVITTPIVAPINNKPTVSNNKKEDNTDTAKFNPNKIDFINNANFKLVFYNIMYKLTNNNPLSKVMIQELNQSLFTVKDDKRLLNYKRDLSIDDTQEPKNIAKINSNLNKLADILSQKRVSLVFMPAVSKYTIYEPYIVNNKLPKDTFFEEFDRLPKRYHFLNTKQILSKAMPVKDLYYGDDSHWSYIASDIIISSEEFKQIIKQKAVDENSPCRKL